jgi:hypothetical protein
LARLLGYCAAGCDLILVYEPLECNSLDVWLHGGDAEVVVGGEALPWSYRLRVVRDAAVASSRPCCTETSSCWGDSDSRLSYTKNKRVF